MQILDAHNDLLMNLKREFEIRDYLKNFCINNEVVKIFTAYYISPKQEIESSADTILNDMSKKFELLSKFSYFIPSVENIGFIKNESDLYKLISLKPFCVTLTWNYDNLLAGGAYGESGLTEFGKKVIKILESNNIVIDVAHLNKKSFLDLCDITTKPLFCSHTSSKEVYNIPRAIDSEQLNLISASNGFVGLCLYSTLLGDKKTNTKLILKHYESMCRYCNFRFVGIGSDFNGTGECNPVGFDIDYQGMPSLLNEIEKVFNKEHSKFFAGESLKNFIEKTYKM